MGYDTFRINEKSVFLFTNSCFVKKEFAGKFGNWTKDKNFYGRWMPENRGSTNFHWHDYPWSDTYKISVEENPWSQPEDPPCDVLLSYVAQLQED